ncbi:hypothetical protein HFP71_14165 [Streptomyces sp. ARC32]
MGVDVVLVQVSKNGSSPRKRRVTVLEVISDCTDVFSGMCQESDTPMLQRVDPYGSLVLTAQQMDQFAQEVNLLSKRFKSASHTSRLEQITALAYRCMNDSSLELHLEGD